jgi:hypothetical protein
MMSVALIRVEHLREDRLGIKSYGRWHVLLSPDGNWTLAKKPIGRQKLSDAYFRLPTYSCTQEWRAKGRRCPTSCEIWATVSAKPKR